MKDIYVEFVGVSELQGDSTDEKHKGQIEVSSMTLTVFQPKSSSASSAGGHTAERAQFSEMLFTADIDRSWAKLTRASAAGTSYGKVKITAYRGHGGRNSTGGGQLRVNYSNIELTDVVVSSVVTNIGSGELPTMTFGLKFGSIVQEYVQHKVDGSQVSTGKAGWDCVANKTI